MTALEAVDHLVFAASDLDAGVRLIESLVAARAVPGGSHPGRGTRNALLTLGSSVYLEIIAPDPEQAAPASGRWLAIDSLVEPRLVTWAAKAPDLEVCAARARERGVEVGAIGSGSRRRPDGALLEWRFTDPSSVVGDGIVPFLIDWRGSAHPAAGPPSGVTLEDLRAEHPRAVEVTAWLEALGISLPVTAGSRPALVATLRTPRGLVELR